MHLMSLRQRRNKRASAKPISMLPPPAHSSAAPQKKRRWPQIVAGIALLACIVLIVTLSIVLPKQSRSSNGSSSSGSSGSSEASPAPAPQPTTAAIRQPTTAATPQPTTADAPLTLTGTFQVLESVPHDSTAFTQGLVLDNTLLYEGTGLKGRSALRKVDLTTGNVLQESLLNQSYFGEGIAYYEYSNNNSKNPGRLIQLTWKEQTGFVYDSDTLELLETFLYNTTTNEGWGITYRPAVNQFVVSDGSQYLIQWNVETRQETQRVAVTMQYESMNTPLPVGRLNELEVDTFSDTVLANVWMQDSLLRIHPDTGFVLRVYDLRTLFVDRPEGTDVLNGIALTETEGEVWVTGKFWPSMYRVRLIDL